MKMFSLNKYQDKFLLSRFESNIYSTTYFISLPRELYLELMKFYCNNRIYKYYIYNTIFGKCELYLDKLDPCNYYYTLNSAYLLPSMISKEFIEAIMENEQFFTSCNIPGGGFNIKYSDHILSTQYIRDPRPLSYQADQPKHWLVTYELFNC